MKTIPLIALSIVLLSGCRKDKPEEKLGTAENKPKSTLQTVVEGATGVQAAREGRKASNKIREISAEHAAELNNIINSGEQQ
jgi:hypothetical protein